MHIPENLFYTKSHEWAEFTDATTCKVGITDFAQKAMGDIVFVNLPEAGENVVAGEKLTDIESVKAVADVFSPVTGTIAEANAALDDAPESLNEDPYGAYIAIIENVSDRDAFLDAEAYARLCEQEENH